MAGQTLVDVDEQDSSAIKTLYTTSPAPTKTTSVRVPASQLPSQQPTNGDANSLVTNLSQRYTNPSLTVTPTHSLSISNTAIPTPTPTEVLLHVRCTGICGSDLHLWHSGRIGPLSITRPCILGHEAAGVVLAVGSAVTHLRAGDRVAIEPGVPCHDCWVCRSGRYNLCENVRFCGVGTEGCEGTVRRFMCHDARYCHVIPEGMGWRTAALLEPLAVVMHAVGELEGKVALGRPVLVCGAGPIGLIALKAARASGAWPLAITDVDEGRLEFARRFVPGVRTKRWEKA